MSRLLRFNATLTMPYWHVGHAIAVNTFRDERADYGQRIVATLSHQLRDPFGSGYDRTKVVRMMTFARAFPDSNEAAGLRSSQLFTPA